MNTTSEFSQHKHSTPKCTNCGAINEWKIGPVIRPIDWIITLSLLLLFGSGLIYLLVIIIIRQNPDNREKICPNCGAKNMWTFVY